MLSRIIQMETTPVSNVINAEDYSDHWFTSSIADYVDEDYDSEENFQSLSDGMVKQF